MFDHATVKVATEIFPFFSSSSSSSGPSLFREGTEYTGRNRGGLKDGPRVSVFSEISRENEVNLLGVAFEGIGGEDVGRRFAAFRVSRLCV